MQDHIVIPSSMGGMLDVHLGPAPEDELLGRLNIFGEVVLDELDDMFDSQD